MTTAIPRDEHPLSLHEIDERTQEAWTTYSDTLRELSGREYDEAEADAWDRLQRELRSLASHRAELLAPQA